MIALLRDQPFFDSLALQLPIRADASRETLARDGKDIRHAPGWVAEMDADRIKTALARVVPACALKHHMRRGARDPERWQQASQLVTHGLLRDAGLRRRHLVRQAVGVAQDDPAAVGQGPGHPLPTGLTLREGPLFRARHHVPSPASLESVIAIYNDTNFKFRILSSRCRGGRPRPP